MNIKKDTIFLILVLLFVSTFFFQSYPVYDFVATGLLILFTWLYESGSFKEKLNSLKKRKYLWWMLGFWAVILLNYFLSEDHKGWIRNLNPRLSLIYFPLSIGFLKIDQKKRNKLLLSIAIVVLIACLVCLVWAIHRYIQTNDRALLYNDSLSSAIDQQSIYTSLLVNLSIYIFVYFIFFSDISGNTKLLLAIATAFLFIISYMLASRNMMLLLYATTLLFIFYLIIKRKKYLEGLTLLLGLIITGFLIFKFFPKTINRFKELAFTHFNYQHEGPESHYNMKVTADQWNGANFRLAAWPCGWQLFEEHPILGVGLGDKETELFKIYEQKEFHFAIETKKNVHNNYLDILYSMGLIGFITFIIAWLILPIFRFLKTRDGLALLIVITLAIAMITEDYFDRTLGGIYVSFFITFILAGSKEIPVKN